MMELRFKQLQRTKAYRDALSGMKENTFGPRKRVIIAPSMGDAPERRGNCINLPSVKTQSTLENKVNAKKAKDPDKDSSDFNESEKDVKEFQSYKTWVKERKQLRKDLNQCEVISDWLKSKPSLTEIEQRVQNVQISLSNDISPSRMRNRRRSSVGQVVSDNSNIRRPPVINQPLPVAFATINEYLARKKLRFYDLFVQADRDKDWKVSKKEFKDAMKRTGIPLKDAEIDQFVHALDENNNDLLEYKELAHARNLYILSERNKKLAEEEALIHHDVDALNPDDQVQNTYTLGIPEVSSSDHIFTSKEQDDEKRLKRQKKREKHRLKAKSSEKMERECCTMRGITGTLIDTFQRQKRQEYEKILELCHLHGIPLSKNLLERVLLHPEDKDIVSCISSLKPASRYLISEEDLCRRLSPNKTETTGKVFPKTKRKISFYSYHVYPPAASVTPKSERMNLSSGPANISRKADCWMTYEEYSNLTRHLDSRFDKSWKPSEEDSYWPSYVFDKVRLYLETPRTQVRSKNSIFDVVHNTTIH